ncbi:hypothetical protein LCGC14_0421370 [marine sediment metagenome]|uniref:Uncharacterized protein n=1 Tax=marine sediment metagenome TaxID=412755 RepID=A0A0F9SQU3_9ZZZZ
MSLKDAHFHQVLTVDGTTAGTPLADQFDSGIDSDIVSMAKYNKCYFFLYWGVGATGTLTLTVIPCDDATPTNTTTAISFRYKIVTAPDTNAAWATSASLITTAGSSQIYVIEVSGEDLPLVSGVKYEYVKLNIAETDNVPKIGGVIIIMDEPRYAEDTTDLVTA